MIQFQTICTDKQNDGRAKRLRIALSADVCEPANNTFVSKKPPLKFKSSEIFFFDITDEEALINLDLGEALAENGSVDSASISVKLINELQYEQFVKLWRRISNRNLAAEITNWNGNVKLLNPLSIAYKYNMPAVGNAPETYQFELIPARDYEDENCCSNSIINAIPECHELVDAIDTTPVACETINFKTIVSCHL